MQYWFRAPAQFMTSVKIFQKWANILNYKHKSNIKRWFHFFAAGVRGGCVGVTVCSGGFFMCKQSLFQQLSKEHQHGKIYRIKCKTCWKGQRWTLIRTRSLRGLRSLTSSVSRIPTMSSSFNKRWFVPLNSNSVPAYLEYTICAPAYIHKVKEDELNKGQSGLKNLRSWWLLK